MTQNNENLRENLLIGLGNPLLDISAVVDKSLYSKYNLKQNDAILADESHVNLYTELVDNYDVEYIAGGSVQNSLRIVQWIVAKPKVTTFFGSVGNDNFSKILEEQATSAGVNVRYQYQDKKPTGTCAVLIQGTHRSLCANLAAAQCFTPDHVKKAENWKLIEGAQFYYVSGFFLSVSPPTLVEVAKYALAHDRPFMMNLSAPFVSQFYKDELKQLLPYVDILFGNETEAETFAAEQNFDESEAKDLRAIALKICKLPKQNESRSRVCVITQGHDPVILAHDGVITEIKVDVLEVDKIIDTNGAGDAFVGGFLAQYIQGQSLEVCVRCANWAARQIVQNSGCTFRGKADFKP